MHESPQHVLQEYEKLVAKARNILCAFPFEEHRDELDDLRLTYKEGFVTAHWKEARYSDYASEYEHTFAVGLLLYTDDELRTWRKQEKTRRDSELEESNRKSAVAARERELTEYKRLRAKYGAED